MTANQLSIKSTSISNMWQDFFSWSVDFDIGLLNTELICLWANTIFWENSNITLTSLLSAKCSSTFEVWTHKSSVLLHSWMVTHWYTPRALNISRFFSCICLPAAVGVAGVGCHFGLTLHLKVCFLQSWTFAGVYHLWWILVRTSFPVWMNF